jgi:hypothetical protein
VGLIVEDLRKFRLGEGDAERQSRPQTALPKAIKAAAPPPMAPDSRSLPGKILLPRSLRWVERTTSVRRFYKLVKPRFGNCDACFRFRSY